MEKHLVQKSAVLLERMTESEKDLRKDEMMVERTEFLMALHLVDLSVCWLVA
jgi:hypothetical protein